MAKQLFHDFAINEIEPWAEETVKTTVSMGNSSENTIQVLWASRFHERSEDKGCDTLTYVLAVENSQSIAEPPQ